jgi:hypothetical protein
MGYGSRTLQDGREGDVQAHSVLTLPVILHLFNRHNA